MTTMEINPVHFLDVDPGPANDPEPWRKLAACRDTDPELFFPVKGDTRQIIEARKVCAVCEVSAECLDYALAENLTHGVWGGMGQRERAREGRRRRRLNAP